MHVHAGALFLLQGLVPTLIGYGTEGALKFGARSSARTTTTTSPPHHQR